MKLAIPVVALLAVAARSNCGNGGDPFEPCAGKICGEACSTCPPNVSCSPPASPTACDPAGRCVTEVAGMCGEDAACAGKDCGAECTIDPPCRSATPPCMMPSAAGICTAAGQCVPLGLPLPACPLPTDCTGLACGAPCLIVPACAAETPPCTVATLSGSCDGAGACLPAGIAPPPACPPAPECVGKACGEACDPCGGMCVHPYASACDRRGACVPVAPWICYDPCAGKLCGDACRVCPPDAPDCAETAVVKACDAAGRCVARTPGLVCP